MNVERIYEKKLENNRSIFKIVKYNSYKSTKLYMLYNQVVHVQQNLENFSLIFLDLANFRIIQT